MSENSDISLVPIWCTETISAIHLPDISETERAKFLQRIRDARLQEVDQIEQLLKLPMTTAQMRHEFKNMVRRLATKQRRFEFEDWAKAKELSIKKHPRSIETGLDYRDIETQMFWECWQASRLSST